MLDVRYPSRFIVFEGGEGTGKSTQAQRLTEALAQRGHEARLTREPGGTKAAERIRGLLVDVDAEQISPIAEALLINAARADHLDKVIRPALAAGQWVICDRFADSTLAYQGHGQGVDKDWLKELRRVVVGATEPGLTLILDLPVEIGLARAVLSQRYERMGRDFHERSRQAFLDIALETELRRRAIDASGDPDQVWKRVAREVDSCFGLDL